MGDGCGFSGGPATAGFMLGLSNLSDSVTHEFTCL